MPFRRSARSRAVDRCGFAWVRASRGFFGPHGHLRLRDTWTPSANDCNTPTNSASLNRPNTNHDDGSIAIIIPRYVPDNSSANSQPETSTSDFGCDARTAAWTADSTFAAAITGMHPETIRHGRDDLDADLADRPVGRTRPRAAVDRSSPKRPRPRPRPDGPGRTRDGRGPDVRPSLGEDQPAEAAPKAEPPGPVRPPSADSSGRTGSGTASDCPNSPTPTATPSSGTSRRSGIRSPRRITRGSVLTRKSGDWAAHYAIRDKRAPGPPTGVKSHDFPDPAEAKAIPCRVYDPVLNRGHVRPTPRTWPRTRSGTGRGGTVRVSTRTPRRR